MIPLLSRQWSWRPMLRSSTECERNFTAMTKASRVFVRVLLDAAPRCAIVLTKGCWRVRSTFIWCW
jgi:hypothetical protein